MYFDNFKTEAEIKERFRLLAKKLHPDVGGDTAIMKEILEEYNKALENIINPSKPQPKFEKNYGTCNDNQEKIDAILDWAENNPSFNTNFVESLSEQLDGGKDLTEIQEAALNKIIKSFRIKINL